MSLAGMRGQLRRLQEGNKEVPPEENGYTLEEKEEKEQEEEEKEEEEIEPPVMGSFLILNHQ
jgi:hypothetical protein